MAFSARLSQKLRGSTFELSLVDRGGQVKNFAGLRADIVRAMQQAMLETALETQVIAYELCAFDTGFMRDHLRVATEPEKNLTWEIGWQASDFFDKGLAFYPMYVVLGTRFVPPRDPLTPAYNATRERYAARIAELVQRALARRQTR